MSIARVLMPRMGASVHEGTVIEWLKKEGDELENGEPLLMAQSEKVEFEIEAPYPGRLVEILVKTDTTVPVGEAIALIETQEPVSPEDEQPQREASLQQKQNSPVSNEMRKALSPRVKRLAAEAGVGPEELMKVPGTGRGGRISEQDLQHYLEERSRLVGPAVGPSLDEGEQIPLSPMRRQIAKRMIESVRTIPQYTSFHVADVSAIVGWRTKNAEIFSSRTGIHLTYTPFVASAVIKALLKPEYRVLNSRWYEDSIFVPKSIHLGIAVALEDGLIVPVVREAEKLDFVGLCRSIQRVADQARQGTLTPEDATGGTFTLTNVGATGSVFATPLINPPEVAILGVGTIQRQVVVLDDDSTGECDKMGLSLTADHRVVDGWVAGRFAQAICDQLESFDFTELNAVVTEGV